MSLMTEVFDAWAIERLQNQLQPYAQPYAQPDPYTQRHYSQGQPWPPAQQQPYPQTQMAYNYNPQASLPAQLDGNPIGQSMPSPAPSYSSPIHRKAVPKATYNHGSPPGGAVELPAELPVVIALRETVVDPGGLVPIQSVSSDVSSSSAVLLARDLWSADAKVEEEKVYL